MILIGTREGLHLWEGPTVIPHRAVTHLAGEGDRWWALLDGREVWAGRDDQGEPVAWLEEPVGRCLLPRRNGLLVGTAGAHLLRLSDGDLEPVAGFDRAEGRSNWYTPWGGPPDTRSLAEAEDGTLYANVHVGGVLRSRDGGDSWSPTLDIDADVHQVITHPTRPGWVLVAAAVGLGVSRDSGESWEFHREGLHHPYSRSVTMADGAVLVGASTGPSGARAAVYRWQGEMERCREGLPEWFPGNVDTHCLAARGTRVALGTEGGSLYLSEDAGRTWSEVTAGLPPVRAVLVA